MPTILPTEEQFQNIQAVSDHGELVMVNLLRFKPEGGEALYEKYSQMIYPIITKIGARVIYYGNGVMTFIGDDYWDAVLLVEYPSRSAFMEMIRDPQYLEASRYRQEGLIDSRLYVTRPQWMGG
ncbi:MAG: DUF1330 domain-containing protein [Desulfobacterales bacterium]